MTRARIIAVVGASGGLGTSTLTAALSSAADAAGHGPVVCVDGHPLSGGLDVVLGAEHERGLRWADLQRARGALDGAGLLAELPTCAGVRILGFDRGPRCDVLDETAVSVVRALSDAAGLVVLDVPPPGRAGLSCLLDLADDAVLVCGVSPPALAAAAAVGHAVEGVADRWWVALRGGERGADDLGDAVSHALEMPFLAVVPDDPRVDADLRRGEIPGARARSRLGVAARGALDVLLLQNLRAPAA